MRIVYRMSLNGRPYVLPLRVRAGAVEPSLFGTDKDGVVRSEWVGLNLEKLRWRMENFIFNRIEPTEIKATADQIDSLLDGGIVSFDPESVPTPRQLPTTVDQWREWFAENFSHAGNSTFLYAMIAAWDILAVKRDASVHADFDEHNGLRHLSVQVTESFAHELDLETGVRPAGLRHEPTVTETIDEINKRNRNRSEPAELGEIIAAQGRIIASQRAALRTRRTLQQVATDDPTGDDIAKDA